MFRRDFVSSLLSFLPASWALQRASAPGSKVPDIKKAIRDRKRDMHEAMMGVPPDILGLVKEYHCSKITHTLNPDFSTRVTMEGWFKVWGGPSVLNAVALKVRREALSGQPFDSPIPRPLAGTRRLSLALTVSPTSNTVHWYAVDNEYTPRFQ